MFFPHISAVIHNIKKSYGILMVSDICYISVYDPSRGDLGRPVIFGHFS